MDKSTTELPTDTITLSDAQLLEVTKPGQLRIIRRNGGILWITCENFVGDFVDKIHPSLFNGLSEIGFITWYY